MPEPSWDNRLDIARIHRMVRMLMDKLEIHISDPQRLPAEEVRHLWDKESDLSVLLKLAQILLKLLPVEQELHAKDAEITMPSIDQHDIEILEQYVERCIHEGRAC